MMSSRGFSAAVRDVGAELLVEELEGLVPDLLGQLGQPGREHAVVRLGHAFEVGDDDQRERGRVLPDELARALVEELVDAGDRRAAT